MRRTDFRRVITGISLLLAAALAIVLTPAGPVLAQTSDSRVGELLHRTDEALASAREFVRERDSLRARDILETAFKLQRQAWSHFEASRVVQARTLTHEARMLGARAVTMAREDASLRERARREMERAVRALQYAKEVLDDRADPQAARLLVQAAEMLERGKVKFGEQRYEVALRLALSAQRLVRQAVGLAGNSDSDRLQRELERTDALIERVAPIVDESGDPEAVRLFTHGVEIQREAWEAYRNGRARAAFALTREARGLVNRARTAAHGPLNYERVTRVLDETDRLLARAAEVVKESGNDHARALLERAFAHQAKARRLLDDRQLRKALAETRVARALAKRAMRAADGEDTE